MIMHNNHQLPSFTQIDIQQFTQQLDDLLQRHLQSIDGLVTQSTFSWDNLVLPLDMLDNALEKFWSPFAHLHAVVNSPELRQCYQQCLPKLSAYETSIGQNSALYQAFKAISQETLNPIQKKILADKIRDFELSGVNLPAVEKKRFETIETKLSDLSSQFENHVLDATQAFTYRISATEESRLDGIPVHIKETAQQLAHEKSYDGWILTLDIPCYLAVMMYAEDRNLRETFYQAYVTRASDQGPFANQYDNGPVIDDIMALRQEQAQLLGYPHSAALSLATKMAESCDEVTNFLEDLLRRSYPQAQQEMQDVRTFAEKHYHITDLKPWDVAWISEKIRLAEFDLSQEDLRPYFPEDTLLNGVFALVKQLYGVDFTAIEGVDVWHPDVKCFALQDATQQPRGYVYIDLYARTNKRGGAWMDSLQSRMRLVDGTMQPPIATLTCNFTKPQPNQVATFSHDEVLTFFHELGHCLHHLLTQIDYLSASGIHGVEWDAVELPSQFFENFCWEKDVLTTITRHTKTNHVLPDSLYQRLLASKNFQTALAMVRQLEFSLFDFQLHAQFNNSTPDIVATILANVRKKTAILPALAFNRFQHSFSHIFAGGYAAGYYSYKWAEVLSSDAYARFEEEGIYNPSTGRDFLHTILEVGGSRKASDSFLAFRGRKPSIDALLRHSGIQ